MPTPEDPEHSRWHVRALDTLGEQIRRVLRNAAHDQITELPTQEDEQITAKGDSPVDDQPGAAGPSTRTGAPAGSVHKHGE